MAHCGRKTINTEVPGTIIHHSAARTGKYVGCPSIVVLPSGEYIASHSHFGPGSTNTDSFLYSSQDLGETWQPIAELHGQIWSNLYLHNGELFTMGTDHCDLGENRLNGKIVIRRSVDNGRSWSDPVDEHTGLLTDNDGWHTAACPVAAYNGRLWRAVEFAPERDRNTWQSVVLSIPQELDPLERSNWQFSEPYSHPWVTSQWIEGNVVISPEGDLVNVLRTNYRGTDQDVREGRKDLAAIAHVEEHGRALSHDAKVDTIAFPGGGTKFTIRFDEESGSYWSLVNKQKNPRSERNRLYLTSSTDLRTWSVVALVLEQHEPRFHAFQYVDWVFYKEDILFVSRTAYDDGEGGAHSFHDANFITFHKIHGFRHRRPEQNSI